MIDCYEDPRGLALSRRLVFPEGLQKAGASAGQGSPQGLELSGVPGLQV
jgi:hypothetical protein